MTNIRSNNLGSRVKRSLTEALNHYNLLDFLVDDGMYIVSINEYQSGIDLIDTLIEDDCFTSEKAFHAVRSALVNFFDALDDGSFRRLRIALLIDDLDAAATSAEAAS